MMKRKVLVMTGIACLVLLPACALGQGQRDSSNTPAGSAETATTPANKTTSTSENRTSDTSGKSKNKQKKNAARKTPPKEPTENERIFDEMLRSAMSGGL
jgi:uncharacterized membrane protein